MFRNGKLPEIFEARQKMAGVDPNVGEQFMSGKLLGKIDSSYLIRYFTEIFIVDFIIHNIVLV